VTQVLRFLIVFEVMGLAGVPLAARALGRLPGAGIGFARILAWLLFAWLVWILGSLGFPNGTPLVIVCAVAVVAAAVILHRRREPGEAEPFRRRVFVTGEVLFVVSFLIALFVGSYASDVWGTEKPMDMMLINATTVSGSFPPHDAWLAGADLNYYYLGQHMLALVIRLTGVEPSQGYNLAVAALFAICVSTAFATGATIAEHGRRAGLALKRPLVAGVWCVVLLALMGSVRGGWTALHADKWLSYDWFGASRVIPNTINEFPFFSLMLGDLHAHVIAIPLTLLALAFAVQGPGGRFTFACAALSVGWLYGVNSWSWPVMAGFTVLAAVALPGRRLRSFAWAAGVVVAGIVLVLPFIVHFDPNAKGIAFTSAAQREPFNKFVSHHMLIEGALLWLVLVPLLARGLRARYWLRYAVWGGGAAALLMPMFGNSNLAGAMLLALLVAGTLAAATAGAGGERVLWLLAATGLACILAAELGTIRDEFAGGELERMNTVFKMGYQAWLLLAVFGAVALAGGRQWLPRLPRVLWTAGAVVLVGISLAYTVVGTYARRAGLKDGRHLDGRRWLSATAPGDVAAIDWLRDHADHDAVVLEAVGDDYSAFGNARVSTYTGLQTIVGWQGHEIQWSHDVGTRGADVQTLYTGPDPAQVGDLIQRYKVDYAVVGPLERTTYGKIGALAGAGKVVFKRKGTTIYAFAA
jgi:YYY domain-containing protein